MCRCLRRRPDHVPPALPRLRHAGDGAAERNQYADRRDLHHRARLQQPAGLGGRPPGGSGRGGPRGGGRGLQRRRLHRSAHDQWLHHGCDPQPAPDRGFRPSSHGRGGHRGDDRRLLRLDPQGHGPEPDPGRGRVHDDRVATVRARGDRRLQRDLLRQLSLGSQRDRLERDGLRQLVQRLHVGRAHGRREHQRTQLHLPRLGPQRDPGRGQRYRDGRERHDL